MTPAEERPAERRPAAGDATSQGQGGGAGHPVQPAPGAPGTFPQVPQPTASREPSIAPSLRASHADRNAVAERLRDAFADGRLDEEEFDVRIQAALSARTQVELAPLLADLEPLGTPVGVPEPAGRSSGVVVEHAARKEHGFTLAVMSGAERKGRWRVPAESTAVAFMGGILLDLRTATLTSQVTTIRAVAIMGGIDIVVPPGVRVDINGLPLMGGGGSRVDDEHLPATAPLVKVQYLAIMGGVDVRAKPPKGVKGSGPRHELPHHGRRELED